MGRPDFVGTWSIGVMRDNSPGTFEADGTIIIGETAADDMHHNPHSGGNPHPLRVTINGALITFYQDGLNPGTDNYIYRGVLLPKLGSTKTMSGRVRVNKRKKKIGDGDDSTWVATSPPVIIDKGKKKGRGRSKKATKATSVRKKTSAKGKSK